MGSVIALMIGFGRIKVGEWHYLSYYRIIIML
jgi:hypothetical protein